MKKENSQKYYLFNYNLNILNLLALTLTLFLFLITFLIKKKFFISNFNEIIYSLNITYFMITIIAWLIIHEVIHGLVYLLLGAKWQNIKFGIFLEKGVISCSCKQNISRQNILISSISPFIIIGILTYIIGLIFNNIYLLILSIMNIGGSIADIFLFFYISRLPKDIKYREGQDATQFYIITNQKIENIKHHCIALNQTTHTIPNEFKHDPNQKIIISKFSKIIISIFIILLIIEIFL